MANLEHLDILKQGKDVWNKWRKEQFKLANSKEEEEQHVLQPDLSGARLRGFVMDGADLSGVNFEGAFLRGASFKEANLNGANLKKAYLRLAKLQHADLQGADLTGATLDQAFLQKANLTWARLEGTSFYLAGLEGANLSHAFFSNTTSLRSVLLGNEQVGYAYLADIHWNDTSLALVDWSLISMLGEEQEARQKKTSDGQEKSRIRRFEEYQEAVRANRQLAVALRDQGLNEQADYFAYRSQVLQRTVFRLQIRKFRGFFVIGSRPRTSRRRRTRMLFAWLFSWLLELIAGYGYRPERSIVSYLIVIFSFTLAYFVFGHLPFFPDALVFSFMSFHGRGFFPSLSSETNLHNPLVELAALEAVIGLFIEISLIATFTGRFFRR